MELSSPWAIGSAISDEVVERCEWGCEDRKSTEDRPESLQEILGGKYWGICVQRNEVEIEKAMVIVKGKEYMLRKNKSHRLGLISVCDPNVRA